MSFTLAPNKRFSEDIQILKNKIANRENFTLSKYADGEWAVIKNIGVNNTEFSFKKDSVMDSIKRDKLIESFQFQHPQYHVGISCPCCQGQPTFEEMRDFSGQPNERLTWANIWVNNNYAYYCSEILPMYSDRKVVLYCNKYGDVDNLPFKPEKLFPISVNAWEKNWNLIEESKEYIKENGAKDMVFLFCCGTLGNILCHELTKFSPDNTYIDIGSTLNPFLKTGFVREYYVSNSFWSQLECKWGE
jgi:hypothetical protein